MHYFFLLFQFFITGFLRIYAAFSTFVCEFWGNLNHLLRHTYATVCIENGFDPKTLSELLGHADASITLNRYVHSSMQMKKKYVSRLRLTA